MAWNQGTIFRGAPGPAGAQLRYGHGGPSSTNPSVQNDLDSYIDVDTGRLYAVRQNGAWPTTYASLIGPQGGTVRVGSGPPTSSNPATQNDTDVYVQLDATNGPALWGPRANGAWPSSSTTLAGAAGKSVLSGAQPPTASDGVDGQPAYLDTANGVLYGAKANGAWPSSGVSLKGPQGTRIYYDSNPPGITLGLVSDYFIRTTTYDLYVKITNTVVNTTADYPNGWQIIGNLKGATGAASTVAGPQGTPGSNGLSVVSNTAAPTSADGVVGSPAFINTSAGTLYGAKTSSGWPSSFLSLVGSKGDTGATGPASASLLSGTGAPTSTNPGGTITAGSAYIQTDTVPNRLFIPYSATSGWPSTYTAMGGGTFQTTSGPPAAALGSVGDCAIDLTNALFYPPKTSGGWTATPINMIGSTGPTGFTSMPNATIAPGPFLAAAALALSSTPQILPVVGTTIPQVYIPPSPSALMGVGVTCNTSACAIELYDQTASKSIYSASIAVSTNNCTALFSSSSYPMTAGNQHVWRVTGSGTTNTQISPYYLVPSSTAVAAVCPVPNWTTQSGVTFSSTATSTFSSGVVVGSGKGHYFLRTGSLYSITATYVPSTAGAAAANVQLQIGSYVSGGASTILFTTGNIPNTGKPIVLGPYLPGTYTWPATYLMFINVIGAGTGQVSVDVNVIC